MAEQVIKIQSAPGIKRDGTKFEGDAYVDGQWARFQRGLPRKIGGYRSISKYLKGVVRSLHEYTRDQLTYIHGGSAERIEQFHIDGTYSTSIVSDRTPLTLAASPANLWQFDLQTTASATGLQLVAQAAPNANCICNSEGGQLFYGSVLGTAPLVGITALPTGYSATGGIVSLHPFTVAFGNDGYVMWTPDCADFTVTGAGFANVTGQKIVRGMPLRGGPGASPSGLLWSADSVVRMAYVGGTEGFSFDTISAQSSILSAQGVVEYDGVFFWAGTDRFLMFNGVVREVPNDLNLNFFYDNLNQQYRQKVFAFKVPRFGEIWWCFPKGTSTEPNHAVIYNVRENTWYDTALPEDGRGAGLFPTVFSKPLMSGVAPGTNPVTYRETEAGDARVSEDGLDRRVVEESGQLRYKFWVHEVGTDAVDGSSVRPIQSYFETSDITLPATSGESKQVQVAIIEPDFVQSGPLSVSIRGRANSRAPEIDGQPQTFQDAAETPQDQIVSFQTQRRQLRFRFESNAVGGDYQTGIVLAHVQPGDGSILG